MKLKGLTDVSCRNAKYNAEGTGNKRADADGLYLALVPSGAKKWRLKYRFNGKENRLSFGEYTLIGLAEAREKRVEARKLLADVDPARQRDEARFAARLHEMNSFKALALELILPTFGGHLERGILALRGISWNARITSGIAGNSNWRRYR